MIKENGDSVPFQRKRENLLEFNIARLFGEVQFILIS